MENEGFERVFLLHEHVASPPECGFYINANVPGHHATMLLTGLGGSCTVGVGESPKREMRGDAALASLDVHLHALTREPDLLQFFEGPTHGFGNKLSANNSSLYSTTMFHSTQGYY